MPRRKTNAATATEIRTPRPIRDDETIVIPPDALEPPYAGEDESVDEPAPELAPAAVTAEPAFCAACGTRHKPGENTLCPLNQPAPTRATPRKVSAETVKAETRLINMERAAQASLVACEQRWADKRRELIRGLPADVQGMLLAGGVIDDDDCEAGHA